MPTSSRLILHLSRLKIAVPAANLVRWRALSSSGWGLGAEEGRDAVCWVPCGAGRARGGEERLVPTSSRLILHLSRLMIAVPAANLVRRGSPAGSG